MKLLLKNILFAFLIVSCSGYNEKEVNSFSVSEKVLVTGMYHTLDGIYSELNTIKDKFRDKVELFELGKTAYYDKSIPLLRVTLGDAVNAKHFLFVAGTHGDEGAPVEAMIYTIKGILNEYSQDNVKNLILDFMPLHNPYGYFENQRKNENGVDLNRNFPIGDNVGKLEIENTALIKLINSKIYSLSIFFHSANEKKYENIIRRPMEFSQLGKEALREEMNEKIDFAISLIKNSQVNSTSVNRWEFSSEMVSKPGIASDWCVSSCLKDEYRNLVKYKCINSHPSLTIELCYPKVPLGELKLNQEKNEMLEVITSLINNYNM